MTVKRVVATSLHLAEKKNFLLKILRKRTLVVLSRINVKGKYNKYIFVIVCYKNCLSLRFNVIIGKYQLQDHAFVCSFDIVCHLVVCGNEIYDMGSNREHDHWSYVYKFNIKLDSLFMKQQHFFSWYNYISIHLSPRLPWGAKKY